MGDQKKKRVSRVREMKNDIILDAALDVFSETGFHETRLEDIAVAAGFSKASLYNYYKDKEMIFLSLAIREHTRLHKRMTDDPLYKMDLNISFEDNLRRMLTLIFTEFGDHFSFIVSLNAFMFHTVFSEMKCVKQEKSSETETEFVDVQESIHHIFIDIMQQAKDEGVITSSLSTEQLHSFLDAVIFGTMREWHHKKEMDDIQTTVEQLINFICSGFGIQS